MTELEIAEWRVRYLTEAVGILSLELIQAGMAEYDPKHSEMIGMGSWGMGLLDHLEVKFERTV